MYESRPIENRASEDRRPTAGRNCECIRGEHQLEDFCEHPYDITFARRHHLINFPPVLFRRLARVFHALRQLPVYVLSIETVSLTAPDTPANTPTTVRDATADTTPRQVWCQVGIRGRRRWHRDTDEAETVG